MGAGDVHEHVAECFSDAVRVRVSVAGHVRTPLIRCVIGDHVEHFLLGRPRQIGDGAIDGFLLHLANLLHG
jgi:hypothetical protein